MRFFRSALSVLRASLVLGGRSVFRDLTLTVRAGSVLFLRGRNGAGKSSLIRAIAGFQPLTSGSVLWEGHPLESDTRTNPSRIKFHWVDCVADGLDPSLTVIENTEYWASMYEHDEHCMHPREAVVRVGLEDRMDWAVSALSTGLRRRASLARLLASPSPIWLLDEPTVAMDERGVALVQELLRAHAADGGIAIVATNAPIHVPGSSDIVLGTDRIVPVHLHDELLELAAQRREDRGP